MESELIVPGGAEQLATDTALAGVWRSIPRFSAAVPSLSRLSSSRKVTCELSKPICALLRPSAQLPSGAQIRRLRALSPSGGLSTVGDRLVDDRWSQQERARPWLVRGAGI